MTLDLIAQAGRLADHPAIVRVQLVGSRAEGRANALSDWDFAVEVTDFARVEPELPQRVEHMRPLAQQWDRLSDHATYMLMLEGGVKVDLIFDAPGRHEPPWVVCAEALPGMDHHFWDWIIWLASKDQQRKANVVVDELAKMHEHLLRPLGVETPPAGIEDAISLYRRARTRWEHDLGIATSRTVTQAVVERLRGAGYSV